MISVVSLCSNASASSVPDLQVITQPDHQVSFQYQGRELLRYHFNPSIKRPFWHPARTSAEASLIRMGHPHDPHGHRHHYGIWLSHASLNGVNFWDDDKDNAEHPKGSIQHQRVIGLWDGDKSASVLSVNHWVADRDQKILLIEKRFQEIRLIPDASSWLLVIESELQAPKGTTATFDVSAFGLTSVRLAKYIGVHDGGGRILNSEGQLNEKEIFRKPAQWCDYSGNLTSTHQAGMMLMNHPNNPAHPTSWHVRDDGWMCASLSFHAPVQISDSVPLRVRYGLWIHDDLPDQQQYDAVWQTFKALPPADFSRKP